MSRKRTPFMHSDAGMYGFEWPLSGACQMQVIRVTSDRSHRWIEVRTPLYVLDVHVSPSGRISTYKKLNVNRSISRSVRKKTR